MNDDLINVVVSFLQIIFVCSVFASIGCAIEWAALRHRGPKAGEQTPGKNIFE